jgi:rare lipoprotein A
MTAAHRTLPFGTHVLVTNLENNKSVVVTISDRGPEQKERIIDVSLAAAQALDMLSAFRTAPHIDYEETRERAFTMLIDSSVSSGSSG